MCHNLIAAYCCPILLVINSLPSFFVGSITAANSYHKQLFSPTEYADVLLIEMKQMYIYIVLN